MSAVVVYFSRAGENYISGSIVKLTEGNSAKAAKKIAPLLKASIFEIKSKIPYPEGYHQCTDLARRELVGKARPPLKADLDVSPYSLIVLIYPIWWDTFPRPVATFLSSHDFAGKTIVPVSTHEGSGLGYSVAEIKELCQGAVIARGLSLTGSRVQNSECDELIERFFEPYR